MDSSPFPANARIESLTFDDTAKTLRVALRGANEPREASAANVAAVFGARIRHESAAIVSAGEGGINWGKLAVTAATGIPMGVRNRGSKQAPVQGEELLYAIAMRIDGIGEVWYLLAASFNFRKALGPEATYSTEMNLRAFVKRLAAFAPRAVQDSFFAAMLGGTPLPPPLESLLEFLKSASAR